MKKHKSSLLLIPVLVSLSMGNVQARGNHDGFIAGACAVGAALIGAAGIAAIADWCCSETDDQLIGRVGNEFHTIASAYQQTIDYFGPRAGVGIHAPHKPIQHISEDVLYEFATFVWNSNSSQASYRSKVWSAKSTLQSCIKDLRKRINAFEGKYIDYEDQKRLATMRSLLKNGNQLLTDVSLFADCLECHKTYFTLYDSVGNIRNKYIQELTIIESGRYSVAAELKQYVLSCDNSRYAFKNFVSSLESNISQLQSDVYYLKYGYEYGRNYANGLINYLVGIKNIIIADPRYQQELYEYEKERLELQRIQALEEQARLERERIRLERERNRILQERNRIEQQKIYTYSVGSAPIVDEISVQVIF